MRKKIVYISGAEIAPIKNNCRAICTIISDDGNIRTGLWLELMCYIFGIKMTVAGYVNNIKRHLELWKAIEKRGNIELVNHSFSHIRMDRFIGREDEERCVRHEILDAKSFYETNFNTPSFTFVAPENCITEMGYKILNKENGFFAVRSGGMEGSLRGNNSISPTEGKEADGWYNLSIVDIGGDSNHKERTMWIQEALNNNRWIIEMWHDVCLTKPRNYHPISAWNAFRHLINLSKYKREGKLWISPFTEATAYLRECQHCKVVMKNDGGVSVEVVYSDTSPPPEFFHYPLTVKITVWNVVGRHMKYLYNGNVKSVPIITNAKEKYIMVQICPGEKVVFLNSALQGI